MTRAMSKVIEYNVDNNSVEKCVAICKQKSKIFLKVSNRAKTLMQKLNIGSILLIFIKSCYQKKKKI